MIVLFLLKLEKQFEITDTKLSVTDITLSIEDNAKLLQQLKSGFKRAINSNKYLKKYQKKEQINI